ncbi:hypothetical protein DERF_008425 [Dermatophagoides farinae]|uniref:Uncharacterized protein n=1 Tax=Dermatophagoides farinae TaxID=6954 RepID=A0A922HZX5_DERFA|nr:hypothetical protein DERF_008425 [Dermatophagoides farinae]
MNQILDSSNVFPTICVAIIPEFGSNNLLNIVNNDDLLPRCNGCSSWPILIFVCCDCLFIDVDSFFPIVVDGDCLACFNNDLCRITNSYVDSPIISKYVLMMKN